MTATAGVQDSSAGTAALSELWRYRELFWFLVWRDVTIRYKQAALGIAWAILQPLSTTIVVTVFVGRLTGIASENSPYPLFVYSALLPWMYFASSLTFASNSLIANSSLLTKIYFPRVLLPAAAAFSGLLDFAIGFLFLLVLMGYYGVQPGWSLAFYPALMLVTWMLTVGVGMGLAALNARYRDVKYVVPVMLQLGLFVTPIMYPASMVPESLRAVLILNPMAGLVQAFRASVLPQAAVEPSSVGVAMAVTLLLCATGAVYFRRTERLLADVV
jgi:lipopolysaccharide transport system permease protein